MNVYFISGLGADERIFKNISLPSGYEMKHIPWQPATMEESIQGYARRLARDIDENEPFILAGLSFGGLVAIEISKFLKPEKLILFSTVETRKELPEIYRLAGKLSLYRFVPVSGYFLRLPIMDWLFGPLDESAKILLRDFIEDYDPIFMKWAIKELTKWQNLDVFKPHVHIQGSIDKLFPLRLLNPNYVIPNAGHLCVFTHANQVNEILRRELQKSYQTS